jgi:hypothetical protein
VGIQLDPLDSAIPHPVHRLLLSPAPAAAAAAQPELLIEHLQMNEVMIEHLQMNLLIDK